MRDSSRSTKTVEALAPAVYSADNTPAAIDLQGFDSALLAIHIGVGGIAFTTANKIEFVLTHSDDNSAYAAVTDADLVGVTGTTSGIVKALTAAHASTEVFKVGYIGSKRYLKLLADFSGTHGTGTPLSALALLGRPASAPVS